MSLNRELIKLKIGVATAKIVKEEVVAPRDRIPTQVEFIDMKQGNQWNPGRATKITAGIDIMFQIIAVVSSTEFIVSLAKLRFRHGFYSILNSD